MEYNERRNLGAIVHHIEKERVGAKTGLKGQVATHLVFADNVFLLGNDVRRLRWMQNETTIAIKARGWHWKPRSLETLSIGDSGEPVSFKTDGGWYRPKQVQEFVCLGAKIDRKGTTETSVFHRRSIAGNTIWAFDKNLFRLANAESKNRAWGLFVVGQALHDCKTWRSIRGNLHEL